MTGKQIEVGSRTMAVTNLDQIMFPQDGTVQSDLMDVFRRRYDVTLSLLEGRPMAMQRFHDGI